MTRAKQGQHLLKMIESVDVKGTDTLQEIDARFWCFYRDLKFITLHTGSYPHVEYEMPIEKHRIGILTIDGYRDFKNGTYPSSCFCYTRNLQTLHDAMPEGWYAEHQCTQSKDTLLYFCLMKKVDTAVCIPSKQYLPTMALAWLHAIISAMIWEIEND